MNQDHEIELSTIVHQISGLSILDSLRHLCKVFGDKVTFSTSFSLEDQVITHLILTNRLPVSIFTLDTGRLFQETYSVWSQTKEKYSAVIQAYFPDRTLLEEFLEQKGPNAFYESVANRKECCFIRKVEPIRRALKDQRVWVTGLRKEHSANRESMQVLEWDDNHSLIKYNPLLFWTNTEIRDYIDQNQVPYNPLHDKGFVSIGCAPCTRAIRPGEDFRAGRWWWEDTSKKECGLHVHAEGQVEPNQKVV